VESHAEEESTNLASVAEPWGRWQQARQIFPMRDISEGLPSVAYKRNRLRDIARKILPGPGNARNPIPATRCVREHAYL
jgi:hypothetical protein